MEEVKSSQEKTEDGYIKFRDAIKKVKNKRVQRIKNAYIVRESVKHYRHTRPKKPEYVLSPVLYGAIIKRVNELMREAFVLGEDVIFPSRMGRLEIRKNKLKKISKEGRIGTHLPINWEGTLRLWYENEDLYKKRTLLRIDTCENYSIVYRRSRSKYYNSGFYQFWPNRRLKQMLKNNIIEGKLEESFLK